MTYNAGQYDVIVIGSGHAGVEAANAAAKRGANTLMLTLNLDMIAYMPCNPSIGGPAKGVVVREIDALGGLMGQVIDKTYIQMRMLNTRKGPAVRALRAQADKPLYIKEMKSQLERLENLTIRQAMVEELIVEDGICKGVITETNAAYYAKSVIVTTGTFMRGSVTIGDISYQSGPNNQRPSIKLSENLEELGLKLVRFNTGTPPRIHANSIDYSKTEIQPGDENPGHFSYETTEKFVEQIPCWLTYTNEETHQIIDDNLSMSAMYSGMVRGSGPRYCPSIEDKVVRFHDKPRHQVFLEPEGRDTEEVYVQGLSTSLPEDVQEKMLHSMEGLENAKIMRTGYAIEYDSIVPTQLWPTLEVKNISGLFTAGQINGTSGYEEAAGQGLMAGINGAAHALDSEPLILDRSQAYIGVMIDDLVTKGTNEPYRLLTSRAEYRLILRHDNADIRLTEMGYKLGLISPERYQKFQEKLRLIEAEQERLKEVTIKPSAELNEALDQVNGSHLKQPIKAFDFMKRPEVNYQIIDKFAQRDAELPADVIEQIEIQAKYQGYIDKSMQQIDKMKNMEEKQIPKNIDYEQINGLKDEAKHRLKEVQPLSVGQASRISGVTPADVSILLVYIEQGKVVKTH